jgi:hypothetical protein
MVLHGTAGPHVNSQVTQKFTSFMRGVKGDKSHYKAFKLERYWDDWNRGFCATAKTHDITWNNFSDSDKEHWNALSQDGKKLVFGFLYKKYKQLNQDSNQNLNRHSGSFGNKTNIYVTEQDAISEHDIVPPLPEIQTKNDSHNDMASSQFLINLMKTDTPHQHPGNIPCLLSQPSKTNQKRPPPKSPGSNVIVGVHARSNATYSISKMSSGKTCGALIDRGANGDVVGSDVQIINQSDRCVDITGIDDHELTGIPIGTAGPVVQSH